MEKILAKIKELGTVITSIQEKNTALEEKYDGVTKEEMKKLSDAGVKLSEELEALQESAKESKLHKEKIENLEKLAAMGAGKEKNQFKEYDAGLARYLRKGTDIVAEVDEKMVNHYLNLKNLGMSEDEIKMTVKGLQVQNNADGGYWVMPERLDQTVSRVFETSPMRLISNVISTVNDSVELIIDDDEAEAEWVSEVQSRSETSTPQIGL